MWKGGEDRRMREVGQGKGRRRGSRPSGGGGRLRRRTRIASHRRESPGGGGCRSCTAGSSLPPLSFLCCRVGKERGWKKRSRVLVVLLFEVAKMIIKRELGWQRWRE